MPRKGGSTTVAALSPSGQQVVCALDWTVALRLFGRCGMEAWRHHLINRQVALPAGSRNSSRAASGSCLLVFTIQPTVARRRFVELKGSECKHDEPLATLSKLRRAKRRRPRSEASRPSPSSDQQRSTRNVLSIRSTGWRTESQTRSHIGAL